MIEWSKNLSLFDENTQAGWRMIVPSDKILQFTFLIAGWQMIRRSKTREIGGARSSEFQMPASEG